MTERRTSGAILAMILAMCGTQAARAQSADTRAVTNENRLFQRFIEDGAVTEGARFEPQFRYDSFRDKKFWSLGPILSFNVAEDIEVGGRVNLETINFDPGGTETGFSDMEVYGKVRLTTKPTQFAIGALLKFPTGEASKGLGTGETDVAFFSGVRHDFGAISLVGNAGFRITQDPDTTPPGLLEGESSVQLGGAALFAMTSKLAGVVELSYETERINGTGSDLRLTLGAEHRYSESFMSRGALVWGRGDGAPRFELILAGVFLF